MLTEQSTRLVIVAVPKETRSSVTKCAGVTRRTKSIGASKCVASIGVCVSKQACGSSIRAAK